MHNDFIIVGPKADPAGVKAAKMTNDAMTAISTKQAAFISRGDNSGTNALELKLWKAINVTPKGQAWYAESGQGMGATLQIANQKNAYTISDRATYLAQKANLDLAILFQGDKALLNVYHVIVVNPAKHANVNVVGGAGVRGVHGAGGHPEGDRRVRQGQGRRGAVLPGRREAGAGVSRRYDDAQTCSDGCARRWRALCHCGVEAAHGSDLGRAAGRRSDLLAHNRSDVYEIACAFRVRLRPGDADQPRASASGSARRWRSGAFRAGGSR